MARSIRIEYPGAFYHVMARGNRREAIFLDEDDRRYFLKAVSEACGITGWKGHAWVLMTNHYHFFIETPEANLVSGMKWLQNAYTRRFNTEKGVSRHILTASQGTDSRRGWREAFESSTLVHSTT